jgi:hypothetical protein
MELTQRQHHVRAGSATEAMPEWMLLLLRVVQSPDVPRYARLFVTKVCRRRTTSLARTAANAAPERADHSPAAARSA